MKNSWWVATVLSVGLLWNCAPDYRGDVVSLVAQVKQAYPYFVSDLRAGRDWQHKADFFLQADYSGLTMDEFKLRVQHLMEGLNGHANLLDDAFYTYWKRLLDKIGRDNPWGERLFSWSAARAYHEVVLPQDGRLVPYLPTGYVMQAHDSWLYLKAASFDFQNVEEWCRQLQEFLSKEARADRDVVIDIRGNGGGSDLFWTKGFIQPFLQRPLEQTSVCLVRGLAVVEPFMRAKGAGLKPISEYRGPIKYPEDLKAFTHFYEQKRTVEPTKKPFPARQFAVLMDGSNFSSSEGFLNFCKATGWARLIGQRSGGDGIGFEPILLSLPSSGLLVRLPAECGLNPDGSINNEFATEPDVLVPQGQDSLQAALDWLAESRE